MTRTLSGLAGGFVFLEGPRWHDGKLWVSDMHDERVVVDAAGRAYVGNFETCLARCDARIEMTEVDVPGAGWP